MNQLGKLVDIATGDVQDEEPKSGRAKGVTLYGKTVSLAEYGDIIVNGVVLSRSESKRVLAEVNRDMGGPVLQ